MSYWNDWKTVSKEPEETSGVYITVRSGDFVLKDLKSFKTGFIHSSVLIANLKYRGEIFSVLVSGFLPQAETLYVDEEALIAIDKLIEANRLLF